MYLFYLIKWSHNKLELYEHLDFFRFDSHAEREGEDDIQEHDRHHHGDGESNYEVLVFLDLVLHGGVAALEVVAEGLAIVIRIGPPAGLTK